MAGQAKMKSDCDPLAELVAPELYLAMLAGRRAVLHAIRSNPKFTSEKYLKNAALTDGADFGGQNASGSYMPALARYTGSLYSVPGLKSAIERTTATKDGPKIMILSALYGPLHPLSPIQNYNLKMQDSPAQAWSKQLPAFLADYVQRNGIRKIGLYLGSSTAYLKVATKAVAEIRSLGLKLEAIQFHIIEGSTRTTPLKHGSRLLCDIGGPLDPSLYDPAQIREKIF